MQNFDSRNHYILNRGILWFTSDKRWPSETRDFTLLSVIS